MGVLSVSMFGTPSIQVDGVPVILPYRKAEALLYYLILKQKVSRSELIGLLWADSDTTTALKNLRHAIYTIRKALGIDIFMAGPRTLLELRTDLSLQCDACAFWESGDLNVYQGEFLKGFTLHQPGLFEDWVLEQRNLFQVQYLKKLLSAQKEALRAGNLAQAEQYGLQHLAIDPLDEDAAVTLMEVYSAQEKFRKAIGLYHELCKNLSDEFSISPLKSTTALYYKIVNEWNSSTYKIEEQSLQFLVGKDLPLRKLLSLCNGPEDQRTVCCALIEGDAGVGKTYLLNHILNHYDFSDRLVCRSFCYPSETNTPLAPWNSIMLTLMTEVESRRLSVPETCLKTAAGLFPCLSANFRTAYVEPGGHFSMQVNYHVALESALLMLAIISQSIPIMLAFEDIHWMDKSSIEMLSLLLRRLRGPGLTVLCTSRNIVPSHVQAFLSDAQRDKILERHPLRSFGWDETVHFMNHYLGAEQPEEWIQEIYRATGGNALLLTQLMNSYQEGETPSVIPRDLESLMNHRLANLSVEERQVLDVISVFTEWVAFDTLSSILTMETLELTYLCHQLCQRMLLQESTRNGELGYTLSHERIKSILVQQQSESARRILHLRVAQHLEAKISRQHTPVYDRLIYHYAAGGDRLKVFQYRVLALNAYTGLSYALLPTLSASSGPQGADDTSLPAYLQALEDELASLRASAPENPLLDDLELTLLHSKSRYCIYSGIYSTGLDALHRLIQRSMALHDTDMLIRAHIQFLYYGIQTYDTQAMEEHLNAGMSLLAGRERSAEYGIYLRLSGLLQSMQGNYPASRSLLHQSIQTFRQLDDATKELYAVNIAGVYNYIAESYRLEGNYPQAFQFYDQAIAHNRSLGYYPGAAVFFTNYGVAAFQYGERDTAFQLFEHAEQIYRSSHEYSGYPITLSYLALYQSEKGEFSLAAENLREAHRISDMLGSPWWKGITLYLSWKIRMLLEGGGLESAQLQALWPESPLEHCRLCLSYLRKLQPTQEADEIEAALRRLEDEAQTL